MSKPADRDQPSNESPSGFNVAAPTVTLPKGGGAIRGIGEKFAANPVNGTGSASVPIFASPGRAGFGPQLTLAYDSGSSNGPFGLGWSLALPSITRRTDKGLPQYIDQAESDIFILSGAEDLVPVLVLKDGAWVREEPTLRGAFGQRYAIQKYRPRIEGLFARVERWVNVHDACDVFWRSISKDNITTWYGRNSESRIADPLDSSKIFSWSICESHDDKGNVVLYRYKSEDSEGICTSSASEQHRSARSRSANRYLKRIHYGNLTPYFPDLSSTAELPDDWCFELVFDYGEHDPPDPQPCESHPWHLRPDPFSSYRSTFEIRTYRLCQRALMFHHFPDVAGVGSNCLVRSTNFEHLHSLAAENPQVAQTCFSYLKSVSQIGFRRGVDGNLTSRAIPSLDLQYSEPIIDDRVRTVDSESLENLPIGLGGGYQWIDLDGEGLPGVLTEQAGAWFYKANLSPAAEPDRADDCSRVRFASSQPIAKMPAGAKLRNGRHQLMDLSGDGHLDFATLDGPAPGFFHRNDSENWEPFKAFRHLPNIDWEDPNLRFVDLTGDGLADILITEDQSFVWYPSEGADGFGSPRRVAQSLNEEIGPRTVFACESESIYLADISGDGLADIVRVRNGEICYWPNLGYGRMGSKVVMDNSPWLDSPAQFNGKHVHLADIDGSGTVDLMYIAGNGVQIYFNQSGNGWSECRSILSFPPVDNLVSIQPLDLLGNGTACLVWSSPLRRDELSPLKYIDLMGGQKPHLLVRVTNNLGAETRISYVPSTKFYVADKLAGTPWLTRIPFVVHVVETVETYDQISRNRFVTRYAYHDGFYDGVEREFRGFGKVEQWDTEAIAALGTAGKTDGPSNMDSYSNVPPVLTKTWFHTGLYRGRDRVSKQFEHEYYREPFGGGEDDQSRLEAMLLPDTVLPTTVRLSDGSRVKQRFTEDEYREACRSLRGSILRQETYALDGTEEEGRPYLVSERNYTIEALQPTGPNRHAAFFSHPRETVDFHYERKLFPTYEGRLAVEHSPKEEVKWMPDPRVSHQVVLQVDVCGNVERSSSIGYGRRFADPSLADFDREKQSKLLITYTQNTFTNDVFLPDAHRIRVPAESTTFELIQLETDPQVAGTTNLFRFHELERKIAKASDDAEIRYEELDPTDLVPGRPYRRPIETVRTLYRSNDLGASSDDPMALLPLGHLESLGLSGESYKQAFTPGLIEKVYRRGDEGFISSPAEVLGSEGGYVDLDGDGNWWIPSGRSYFTCDASGPQQEKEQASACFYQPHKFRDPFGNESCVSYDTYSLFVTRVADAVGNISTVVHDYRVVQPCLVTDPNLNRSAVSFDILGMVSGTASMGKADQELGDSLDGFSPDLTQTQIDEFFEAADPHVVANALLGGATSRIIYDLDSFASSRKAHPDDPAQWRPTFAATLSRETHLSDLKPGEETKIQIAFSYSDGFGREIQKKVQAEPGRIAKGGPIINPRWVGSGCTIFNNKGKPVRQYEPFFSSLPTRGHDFEFGVKVGVSPVLFYDPLGRVVATLHPNHTYEKVVFDPWIQKTWDVNDTVLIDPASDEHVGANFRLLESADYLPTWYVARIDGDLGPRELGAAKKTSAHANTPSTAHFDTLGRPFLTIADNGKDGKYPSRVEIDIEGNQRSVRDAIVQAGDHRGRIVMRYDYDMLGSRIHQASMEAGERWVLNDVLGKPIRQWDSRGHEFRTLYDALRRPTDSILIEDGVEIVVGRTTFGEVTPTPETNNLRGKPYQQFDQAGVVTTDRYDFKGALLHTTRQLAKEYKTTLDWQGDVATEERLYESATTYDALGRPISMVAPDRSVIRPSYNEANLVEQIGVRLRGVEDETLFVKNIDYDAKGRRTLIELGNGARTTYRYDPETFRMTRLKTIRLRDADRDHGESHERYQDLSYTFDPVGNITHIADNAQQTLFFRGHVADPSNDYVYDAIYRLVEATGREHLGQTGGHLGPPVPWDPFDAIRSNLDQPGDGNAMGKYVEEYAYDEVGNILSMRHGGFSSANGVWNRKYGYAEASQLEPEKTSNRLSATTIAGETETYQYLGLAGLHGSMTSMPNLHLMQWDYRDQLEASSQQVVESGVPEITWYVYDSSGQRVRKVTEGSANDGEVPRRKKERVYLNGFEIYREYAPDGSTTLERETLHVMDDKSRVALVETRTIASDDSAEQLIRYQISNHLGSVGIEVGASGEVLSYEEFSPYGSTSYQALDKSVTGVGKRYRYTSKERDEENGLSYHGARYYAPWLGRWTACDPSGVSDGNNLFQYVHCRPLILIDNTGRDATAIADFGRQVAMGGGAATAGLLADDATIIGVIDDFLIPVTVVVGVAGLAVWGGATLFKGPYPSPARPRPEAPPKPSPEAPPRPAAPEAPPRPAPDVQPRPVPEVRPTPAPPEAAPRPLPPTSGIRPRPIQPRPIPDTRPAPDTRPQPEPQPKQGDPRPDDGDPNLDALVVRGGIPSPDRIQHAVGEHKSVPGLTGFSVQSAPGMTIEQLAAAGQFRHGQIGVTTVRKLLSIGVTVVPSPGRGFHNTVITPMPLSNEQAALISSVFRQQDNPAQFKE